MRYVCLLLCLFLLHCVKAQNNLRLYAPPACKDFLYYECRNSFLFPKYQRDDRGAIVPKSKLANENPSVCLLSGNATVYQNKETFTVIPHSLEKVTLLCNKDTIRLEVFHLTYKEAELLVCSKRDFLPDLKTYYTFDKVGIVEKYRAFQEITFYADSLKAKIQRDTVFIRFKIALSKHLEHELNTSSYFDIDSITINLKNSQGFSLKKTTIKVINNIIYLHDILDYQKDIKIGNTLEISCSRVFRFEYTKKTPIYWYYVYYNKPPNYDRCNNFYDSFLSCNDTGWGEGGWEEDPFEDYGIPAIFRIKFY
jgi:hypothetical protein